MNRMNQQQKGFSGVEILLVVIVLAIIGLLGWRFYVSQRDMSADAENNVVEQAQVPAVNDSSDLEEMEEFVNGTDVDSALDTSEIDATLE